MDNSFIELIDIEEEEESKESEEKEKENENKLFEHNLSSIAVENNSPTHELSNSINMLLEVHCEVFTPPPEKS
jgi:hypothetical protein